MKFTVATKLGGAAKSSEASKITAAPWHNWEMQISNAKHKSNLGKRKYSAMIPEDARR